MENTSKKPDFTRHPYRDIFANVGRKLGMPNQNVRRAYISRNPNIVKEVNKELKVINQILRENRQLEQEAVSVSA